LLASEQKRFEDADWWCQADAVARASSGDAGEGDAGEPAPTTAASTVVAVPSPTDDASPAGAPASVPAGVPAEMLDRIDGGGFAQAPLGESQDSLAPTQAGAAEDAAASPTVAAAEQATAHADQARAVQNEHTHKHAHTQRTA
jgi:hypothetical protein